MTDTKDKLDDLLRRAQVEAADADLFAPPPPNEACLICFRPHPHSECLILSNSCCGALVCGGCMFKQLSLLGRPEEQKYLCAFCRTPIPYGPDRIKAVEKLMRKQNPRAFTRMGIAYKTGDGVPQNQCKALEMFAQAANLGDHNAYLLIAEHYHSGLVVAQDRSRCCAFLEVAAKKGSAVSHQALAELNEARGDVASAIQHYKVAACAGLQSSMTALKKAFRDDLLPKEELKHCLRAFQASDDKMKSKDRDAYLAYASARGNL